MGQVVAPEARGPGEAAAAAAEALAEAEGEAPAPPKLVLGVPPKFAVTPAVEKAVHDIDEVLQWFLSARASHRLSPSHDQPSVHRQRDRFHRALDQLAAEARRHPAMLEAAREHEGIDRHAKLMLIGLDRAEHLDEYAWVMEELLIGHEHPASPSLPRMIDGLALEEFFREQPRRRYLGEYLLMAPLDDSGLSTEWFGMSGTQVYRYADPRTLLTGLYLVECTDTEYTPVWVRPRYRTWGGPRVRPALPPDVEIPPFGPPGPYEGVEIPDEIAAIRDAINAHARPLLDPNQFRWSDMPRYPPGTFMEPEGEEAR